MKVIVTGGAGFIGSHIVDALVSRGDEVVVLDDLSSGRRENVPAGVTLAVVDLGDPQGVDRVVAEVRPDAICHQGAQTSVSRSVREPMLDARTNVLGTLGLLESAAAHGVRRFVLASTGGAIYGEVEEGRRARVGDELLPISPYACSKLAAETYVGAARRTGRVETTVLRYANVYGPRQDPHGEAGVVAIFSQRLLAGEAIRINARRTAGDEGCVRDYVYVDDVVRANLRALDGRIEAPIVNVCSGVAATTRRLAERLGTLAASRSPFEAGEPRAGDLERSVLEPPEDPELVARVALDEGLERTLRWFRDAQSKHAR